MTFDPATRLALEASTDAAAKRILEGGQRDARDDPAARPRLLEHELREHGRQLAEARELEKALRRVRLVALIALAVLAALAVAYLFTTDRVPMILV